MEKRFLTQFFWYHLFQSQVQFLQETLTIKWYTQIFGEHYFWWKPGYHLIAHFAAGQFCTYDLGMSRGHYALSCLLVITDNTVQYQSLHWFCYWMMIVNGTWMIKVFFLSVTDQPNSSYKRDILQPVSRSRSAKKKKLRYVSRWGPADGDLVGVFVGIRCCCLCAELRIGIINSFKFLFFLWGALRCSWRLFQPSVCQPHILIDGWPVLHTSCHRHQEGFSG